MTQEQNKDSRFVVAPIDLAFSSGNYALVKSLAFQINQKKEASKQASLHANQLLKRTQDDIEVILVGVLSTVFLIVVTWMSIG